MPPVKKPTHQRQQTYFREWRKFKKLSQEELAARLELDRSNISRIERGESPYDQDYLERFALAVGCDPEDVLSINPTAPDAPRLIYNRLKSATPEMQRRALDVLDALLKAG